MKNSHLLTIILNWTFFLASPLLVILINSLTFYRVFNRTVPSGSFAGTKTLIFNFAWNIFLLLLMNYLVIWRPAYRKFINTQIDSSLEVWITFILVGLIIIGILATNVSHFSVVSIALISVPEICSIPWMLYLTYHTWKYQNIRFFSLVNLLQISYICLLLNNFYGFTN